MDSRLPEISPLRRILECRESMSNSAKALLMTLLSERDAVEGLGPAGHK